MAVRTDSIAAPCDLRLCSNARKSSDTLWCSVVVSLRAASRACSKRRTSFGDARFGGFQELLDNRNLLLTGRGQFAAQFGGGLVNLRRGVLGCLQARRHAAFELLHFGAERGGFGLFAADEAAVGAARKHREQLQLQQDLLHRCQRARIFSQTVANQPVYRRVAARGGMEVLMDAESRPARPPRKRGGPLNIS